MGTRITEDERVTRGARKLVRRQGTVALKELVREPAVVCALCYNNSDRTSASAAAPSASRGLITTALDPAALIARFDMRHAAYAESAATRRALQPTEPAGPTPYAKSSRQVL